MGVDPRGVRLGYTFRDAFDQIYDGQHTGRWDYTQLAKTEKTHIGTIVEIALQREFGFADGDRLDYRIADVDVDCKWSRNLYDWEIPQEMYNAGDGIALLVWANDYTSRWAAGLLRITEKVLLPLGRQRDGKRRLSPAGKDRILWLFSGEKLVENTLLHVSDPAALARIVNAPTGQQAVNNLFYELQGQLINRATVLTAAQQTDGAKRVRDARKHLVDRGIVILGHYRPHPQIAVSLGLPAPTLGRFVSARLVPAKEREHTATVEIDGLHWRMAREGDAVVPAPMLPNVNRTALRE